MRQILLTMLLLAPPAAAQDTGIPCGSCDDDADGYTVGEGDCDDGDPEVNPGRPEVCYDRVDNDCNGLFDEGCSQQIRQSTIRGGGGCTGGGAGAFLFLPLLGLGGRRRGT